MTCTSSKTKTVCPPLVPMTLPSHGTFDQTHCTRWKLLPVKWASDPVKDWLVTHNSCDTIISARISCLASWCYSMQNVNLEKTTADFSSLAPCQCYEGWPTGRKRLLLLLLFGSRETVKDLLYWFPNA